MARPRKAASEQATETVGFRVTPADRVRYEHMAAAAGVSLSAYLRAAVDDRPLPVKSERQHRAEAITALYRLGNNLNQITRRANMEAERPEDHADLMALVADIRATMRRLDP